MHGVKKTHDQLIEAYTSPKEGYEKTAQELFIEAAVAFSGYLSTPGISEEAGWGLQEAINEYLAGQTLLGNDLLIKGLRTRFPNTGDTGDPDHLTLLTWSAENFQQGIDEVVDALRTNPGIMRAGENNSQFPFWVENSSKLNPETGVLVTGDTVECEMYRFTDIVDRAAMASNAKAKRMFFFGNVKDVDNFPYGNFPENEDLDLNDNGVQDEAGREEAAQEFKRSAHATYLHTALLAAIQSESEFSQNNGYQLKRQILDAQKSFDDINAGFNPLLLQGDYIPYQSEGAYHESVQKLLMRARAEVSESIQEENDAKNLERSCDQDETSLRNALRTLQESYIERIKALTGIPSDTIETYDLTDPDDRERLYGDAEANAELGIGQMGVQKLLISEAAIAVEQAQEALDQYPEKIRNEQDRNYDIAQLTLENGKTFSALSFSEAILSSTTVELTWPPKISWKPNAMAVAGIRGYRDLLSAMQSADIGNINSDATVKQMLLDQALAAISLERVVAEASIKAAQYNELKTELERTVANYLASRKDFAAAYFMNPAYRLERDIAIDEAEESFAAAMEECFYATKALEYLWSEKLNNPVMADPMPLPLIEGSDEFRRAESVFAVKYANDLDDFLDALADWDYKLRRNRTPPGSDLEVTISIKNDILGFTGGDEEYNTLLFRDFILKNRVDGLNLEKPDLVFDFALEIADEKLFTDHPNIKITGIQVDLVSIPARSVYDENYVTGYAGVDLFMTDKASIRTFFAEYPVDDDILIYDLPEGRTLEQTPFQATVQATVDNWPTAPTPNDQLAGHSPAVTQWVLRIKMNRGNNRFLLLENLYDIKLKIFYHFGKPPAISFP